MKQRSKKYITAIDPNKGISVIETNLYDLVEAVSAEVLPREEELIPVIVEHILEASCSIEESS